VKTLKITIDTRCCDEKRISVEEFQKKIHNELQQYKIEFLYSKSPLDSFCECGHINIGFVNIQKKEQDNIIKILENIYSSGIASI
jgi:hypothetical protein